MIIQDSAANTASNDQAFTIAATGKAFRILSNGLYSDKIKAIIRELSCNARDSHVSAGNDQPWHMHLPNFDEPWFEIKDYGTGLSDDDVQTIYTRYFASTKTSSNAFVGQLGLGSKSPFSYTREFTVISRHAGVENRYRMYFDASDTPRVEHLCSGPAVDTGISVRFDVNAGYERWHRKAEEVLRWFREKPLVTGAVVDISTPVPWVQGTGWRIFTGAAWNANNLQAEMGGVLYPIDLHSIPDCPLNLVDLNNIAMVIEFGIGDLDVAASRESISYDARTCDNIKAKSQHVIDDLHAVISADVAGAPTLWAARVAWSRWFKGTVGYALRQLYADRMPTHGNDTVDNDIIHVTEADAQNWEIRFWAPNAKTSHKFQNNCVVTVHDSTKIIVDDCAKGGIGRARHHHQTQASNCKVYLFSPRDPQHSAAHVSQLLQGAPVVLTSGLDVPPKTVRNADVEIYCYRGHGAGRMSWKVCNDEHIPEDDKLYVEISNWMPCSFANNFEHAYRLVRDNFAMLGYASADDVTVYGVKKHQARKVIGDAGWLPFGASVTQRVAELLAQPAVVTEIENHAAANQLRDVVPHTTNRLCGYLDRFARRLINSDSDFLYCLALAQDVTGIRNRKPEAYRALAAIFGVAMPQSNSNDRSALEFQQKMQKYSLLTHVSMSYGYLQDDLFEQIARYVDAVDTTHMWNTLSRVDDAESQ
jgi:hypothetical protein